jgi:hypothetical protein
MEAHKRSSTATENSVFGYQDRGLSLLSPIHVKAQDQKSIVLADKLQ